jgi:hypothetical protein
VSPERRAQGGEERGEDEMVRDSERDSARYEELADGKRCRLCLRVGDAVGEGEHGRRHGPLYGCCVKHARRVPNYLA